MSLFQIIYDIFLEKKSKVFPIFSPTDLTQHYTVELWNLFLDAIYVGTPYKNIEESLGRYKYFSDREYVEIFVDILSKLVDKYHISGDKKSLIVPVPMHWTRYIFRWFHHTKYITHYLSKQVKIPTKNILSAKWSSHQSKLSREKRLENKKNRFTMKYRHSFPETVILFDDVISTGSTANECAKVLKSAWVKKVIWIFLTSNH
jgi:ComF family protein